MKWFNADVRAFDRPLEQGPKILQPIRVNDLLAHILNGRVHGVVNEFRAKAEISPMVIRIGDTTAVNVLMDERH